MKHKLKRILKLNIFVLGMLILLTNCQTEDLVLKNESITKSKAVVTKLNYEQFLRQQNVKPTVEKLKKIELTKISNSKNRSNTERAIVTIDSSSINQVIKDGVVSYTFKVINSDLEANTFENLVIQTNTTQQTNAYLIKYTPSISLGMGIQFEGVKEVTPLDSNTTINTTNKTTVCVSITTYYHHYLCDQILPTPVNCDYQYTTESTETSCETLSDGTNNNSDSIVFYTNPSSGGGGGTTGGNDSNYDGSDTSIHGNGGTPINTAPLFDENAPIDHVAELKKLTNNKKDGTKTNIKLKIDELLSRLENTGSTTTTEEDGAMFDSNQNSLPPNQTGGYFTKWYGYGPEYHITLHMHQNKYWDLSATPTPVLKMTNPVPSDKDTYNLLLNFDFTNNPNATSIIVSRLGVFALRIENQSNADNSYNQLTNNPDEIRRFQIEYDDLIMTPLGLIPSDENLALQGYISLINNYQINDINLGLGIYQAVFDSNNNIINWIKL